MAIDLGVSQIRGIFFGGGGSPYYGLKYFGVYIGVPWFWETTILRHPQSVGLVKNVSIK